MGSSHDPNELMLAYQRGVGAAPGRGLPCSLWLGVAALPGGALALHLVRRAAPVSGALAGALVGLGAGLVADAALHLHCAVVDPWHVALYHGFPVVLLALLGAGLGRRLTRW
jgi:hypothetical protein